MSFELFNDSVQFQNYINTTLREYLNIFVLVYLDDILMFFESENVHTQHVRLVLARLLQYRLYIKLKKCEFSISRIEFLDFIVSALNVKMKLERIIIIMNWLELESHKDVQIFLEFTNFYRRFIKNFSRIVSDLSSLFKSSIKKKFNIKFAIIFEARAAFSQLKIAFTFALMLRHFNLARHSRLEVDAFNFVISEIISQLDEKFDQWHSIAYWFRKMNSVERNYSVEESELLIIIKTCK
jgi:hypothetical protein